MAKTDPIKIRKHAPYRKSFLIPLWVLQLSFSLALFIYSCISLGYAAYYPHSRRSSLFVYSGISLGYYAAFDTMDGYGLPEWLTLDIIHCLLNLFLTSSVIFVIIKFSTYTLSTELFKIQSIVAVVLSGICTVISLATMVWLFAIFSGIPWLASIAICGRVWVLRKRVQRGEAAEMKRRTTEGDGEEVKLEDGNTEVDGEGVKLEDGNKFRGVERGGVGLEDGNKFRGVESEVTIMSVAHHVPRPL